MYPTGVRIFPSHSGRRAKQGRAAWEECLSGAPRSIRVAHVFVHPSLGLAGGTLGSTHATFTGELGPKKSTRFSASMAIAAALTPFLPRAVAPWTNSAAPIRRCLDGRATPKLIGQLHGCWRWRNFSAVAQGSFDDVVNACQAIAIDLDADAAAREKATNAGPDNQAKAWCDLAVAQIGAKITASGGATLTCEAAEVLGADRREGQLPSQVQRLCRVRRQGDAPHVRGRQARGRVQGRDAPRRRRRLGRVRRLV